MKTKFFLLFSFLILSLGISSHQRSESYSKVHIDSQNEIKYVEIDFSVQISVLQRLGFSFNVDWENRLQKDVLNDYRLNKSCSIKDEPIFKPSFSTGYLSIFWTNECGLEESEIVFNLFFDKDSSHTHISTFLIDTEAVPEKIYTNSDRFWNESSKKIEISSKFNSFFDYLLLGFNHILSGFDHLAFLIALLILKVQLKRLILIVTGFTIGHSITLVLGALGLLTPSSQLVEALIGYSIVIIALECAGKITSNHLLYSRYLAYISLLFLVIFSFLGHQKFLVGLIGITLFSYCYLHLSSRYSNLYFTIIITSLFGLIHGFGFAGNLSSLGLMEGRLIPAILGFNLGVELGQLLVILIFSIIFFQIGNFFKTHLDTLRIVTASGLSCLGIFWFVERLI